ncbi:D-3-phosphoglycerate dehydrogenase [Pirellulimonas nuda]|uniref:D-3-phosphoglycerate dehydrogenase n=1 Tax=Pirellulimonas nuda TaxID=2528009 RepID=A0A518DDG2_9BACT|nr:NAD(P)-dependent oxidoreductase [Pirellulimonas nuda]QDU89493.1 D-3-phosphoglycerate dehydrogenase [Pirellulimonas nuda]
MGDHWEDRRAGRWSRLNTYDELYGSTVCGVGLGDIGKRIALTCSALGMTVVASTRQPDGRTPPGVEVVVGLDALSGVLPGCDHVVVRLPSAPATRGLFNRELLECMKPGARFYDVGRGDVVEASALVDALQTGRIGAAGLDVFAAEPPASTSPLWRSPT